MITSTSNQQIKNIVKLQKSSKARREQRVFLVEGIRMFREIPEKYLVKAFVTEEWQEQLPKDWTEGERYEVVSNSVFREISDTQTPQGVLAIVRQQVYQRKDLLGAGLNMEATIDANVEVNIEAKECKKQETPCILVLENLQDPGNLGTILRTAEGAGVTGIMMSKDTVDIYNSKVVRSTMGAIFRMPFCYEEDIQQGVVWLQEQGITCYAAHLNGQVFYGYDYRQPCCFFIGNEGNGLTAELTAMANQQIQIPMAGQVESLNAATAATVLMYEAMRQRYVG